MCRKLPKNLSNISFDDKEPKSALKIANFSLHDLENQLETHKTSLEAYFWGHFRLSFAPIRYKLSGNT